MYFCWINKSIIRSLEYWKQRKLSTQTFFGLSGNRLEPFWTASDRFQTVSDRFESFSDRFRPFKQVRFRSVSEHFKPFWDIKNSYFEISYSTVIKINDKNIKKTDLEKLLLCDLQKEVYPKIEKIFINLMKDAGFPELKLDKKVDFDQLYQQRLN